MPVPYTESPSPTDTPLPASPSPTAAETSSLPLPTYEPKNTEGPLFAEELLSHDGEPIASQIWTLISKEDLTKESFLEAFSDIILQVVAIDDAMKTLMEKGRTLTTDRKQVTIDALIQLTSDELLIKLEDAYMKCPGEGKELPMASYCSSIDLLLNDLESMEDRIASLYELDNKGAGDYKTVLSRYMGETVDPREALIALEELAQTEAYAVAAALRADPEVVRKKEKISLGGFTRNLSFLRDFTLALCPLPDGSSLSIPCGNESDREMDLLQLAFHYYPGMAFLKIYAERSSLAQQARWENAPDGYLAGIAIHGSYAVIPCLDEYELEYVQYKWYEDMLYVTLTGISALLIHYYGYSQEDLSAYLESWGVASFTDYLYDKAMFDPFESLVASYGYYQYLDICQAALDAGCENERQFFQDYLAAGPAPFLDLKEYMVSHYQKQG